MGKTKHVTVAEKVLEALIGEKKERDFAIIEASIKDDFCEYTFEVTSGTGVGDKHGVKGAGYVKDSLKDAMAEFGVHMAVLDDVFKITKNKSDLSVLKSHELAFNYVVNGIKLRNDTVSLTGTKHIDYGSNRIKYSTPFISIDQSSGYKWYNELSESVGTLMEEVAMYREGNYIPVNYDDVEPDKNQMEISFSTSLDKNSDAAESMEDFNKALVD